jgi:hypothetical protein
MEARSPSLRELVGWKAVAAHLRVSVRTAQDFEKTRGLPVRRGAGIKAPVFALIAELEDWKKTQAELAPRLPNNGGADVEFRSQLESTGPEDRQLDSEASLAASSVRPEVAGPSGTSAVPDADRQLAGHPIHILLGAGLVAAMFATTVIMELAYAYGRYRAAVWQVTPLVLLWMLACALAAVAIDSYCLRRANRNALWLAALALAAGAAVNFLAVRPLLPSLPVTQASFQTWTAQAAYLKGVVYCTAFSAFFLLVSFNFVVALEGELRGGRHHQVFDLLTGSRTAVAPRGAPFVPTWMFWSMLVVGAIYSLLSTAHLLEALNLTPYTNLFILTIQIRWVLFLLLGVECCWWYYSALEQIKRECIAFGRGSIEPGVAGQPRGIEQI